LRILYCSQNYCPHDHRFLTALSESEHEVFWYRLENRAFEERPLPKSIQVVAWKGQKSSYTWFDYPMLVCNFKRVVKSINPDIIHAGPIQTVALVPALGNLHPLMSMSWGFDLLQDMHRDGIWKAVTKFVLRRSSWLIADCQTVKKIAMQNGFPEEATTIFPWGVDPQLFQPDFNRKKRKEFGYENDFVMVHTRSWESRYGVDIALKGFLSAYRRNPSIRMIMLGGGSQENSIKQFVSDHNLQDHILFKGYQKNQNLVDYYQIADAYLSASHIDGSSVALLESMACGCPGIVSDIPSNLEWISDGIQGWTFKDGDSESLGEAILQAADDSPDRRKRGLAAREKAQQDADWNKSVSSLLNAYEQCRNEFLGI